LSRACSRKAELAKFYSRIWIFISARHAPQTHTKANHFVKDKLVLMMCSLQPERHSRVEQQQSFPAELTREILLPSQHCPLMSVSNESGAMHFKQVESFRSTHSSGQPLPYGTKSAYLCLWEKKVFLVVLFLYVKLRIQLAASHRERS